MSILSSAFQNRNFRWIFGGGAVSLFGDQFTRIALPWLALTLNRDPSTLGLVLAAISLPRVLLVLPGGALVDRLSARAVLVYTKLLNGLLLGVLCLLASRDALSVPVVLLLSLFIGVVAAFSAPAASAILPQSLPPELLTKAVRVMVTAREASVLIGSIVAGTLIAVLEQLPGGSRHGLALALGFDAFSFLFSAWTMARVTRVPKPASLPATGLLTEIGAALRQFWADPQLRWICLYSAAVELLLAGPIDVALPVIASEQLPHGAAALGLLIAAQGAGMLVGMAATGLRLSRWALSLGAALLVGDVLIAVLLVPLGYSRATWCAVTLLAAVGVVRGYIQVSVFTWIQGRVAPALLGRTMGLIMFINLALTPIGLVVSGLALRYVSPGALFAASSALVLVTAAAAAAGTPIRRVRAVHGCDRPPRAVAYGTAGQRR